MARTRLTLHRETRMNVVQLAMFLTPMAGLLGGASAADGHGMTRLVFGGGTGLLTGLALYPGAFLLAGKLSMKLGLPDGRGSAPTTPWWVWAVLCYSIASPFIAFFISGVAVRSLIG